INAYDALGNTKTSLDPFTIKDAIDITAEAWNNITKKVIKNCWKATGILPYFSSENIPISFQEINTRESIPTITSTISSRESTPTINQENLLTVTSHTTNQEGSITTYHKSSTTTNLKNYTTTVQNDSITINQYGIVTTIQNNTITTLNEDENEIQVARQEFLIEQQKELEKIQGLINQLDYTNPISADEYINEDKRISIEEFLDDEMINQVIKEISPSIEYQNIRTHEKPEETSLIQSIPMQIEEEIQIPSIDK
ncbi:13607_t:CDS:2, partial [Acaulospora morrowiae]